MRSEVMQSTFLELVKLLLFSHRYNKNDAHLQDPLVEWDCVRNQMYKYSKHAQEQFLDLPTFSFLFSWFVHNPRALTFAQGEYKKMKNTETDPLRMVKEVELLGKEAG